MSVWHARMLRVVSPCTKQTQAGDTASKPDQGGILCPGHRGVLLQTTVPVCIYYQCRLADSGSNVTILRTRAVRVTIASTKDLGKGLAASHPALAPGAFPFPA